MTGTLRDSAELYAASPLYFVIESGELVRDANVAENRSTSCELGALVIDESFRPTAADYDYRLDIANWGKPQYVKHGAWLVRLVNAASESTVPITARLLTRAYYMGIAAPVHAIAGATRFGNLPNYYRAIGAEVHYERGVYDNWTVDQFADYVEEVYVSKLPGQELNQAIQERAQAKEGPSKNIIRRSGYTLSSLLELRGYPDFRRYGPNDCAQWGAIFMLANDGQVPRFRGSSVKGLPPRRAPRWETVVKHTGGVAEFQAQSALRYAELCKELDTQAQRLARFLPRSNGVTLIHDFLRTESSPAERLRVLAQYTVLGRLHLPLSAERRQVLGLRLNPHTFSAILQQKYHVAPPRLYAVAEELQLHDAIWGLFNRLTVLRMRT